MYANTMTRKWPGRDRKDHDAREEHKGVGFAQPGEHVPNPNGYEAGSSDHPLGPGLRPE